MTIAEKLLPEFDDEMARTRKILAVVPQELLDWKPGPAMQTIGWNANHLVEMVGWTSDILNKNEFDIAPPDGSKYEMPSMDDPSQIVASFDSTVKEARAAWASASDETLAEDWTMKMSGQTLFTMKKGDCIRKWVMNHSIHHRAILSIYLRMCGVEHTSVYDE